MFKNAIHIIFQDFYSPLKPASHRFFIIDLLRFLAIILMIIYHFIYDLNFFKIIKVDLYHGLLFALPRVIVTLFLISSAFSFKLKDWKDYTCLQILEKFYPRLIKLFVFASFISIVTFFMFPKNWIYFGTIHCFFGCTLLSCLFLKRPKLSALIGLIFLGNFIFKIIPLRDPLDIANFKSIDFIPLYPWFGVFLIGLALADKLKFKKRDDNSWWKSFISYVSQKSLPIYMTHQVVLFSIAWIVKKLI